MARAAGRPQRYPQREPGRPDRIRGTGGDFLRRHQLSASAARPGELAVRSCRSV